MNVGLMLTRKQIYAPAISDCRAYTEEKTDQPVRMALSGCND